MGLINYIGCYEPKSKIGSIYLIGMDVCNTPFIYIFWRDNTPFILVILQTQLFHNNFTIFKLVS